MAQALRQSPARKLLVANLSSQVGETEGFTASEHLDTLALLGGGLTFDAVFVEESLLEPSLEASAQKLGAQVVSAQLADRLDPKVHNPRALAQAVAQFLQGESHGHDISA